ncbi:MAG: methyltransferase domain-containing protein [Lachnospiraceae bacterium]|nr:methyltransferase domain-containing protein [Lachnospiraceae bacterium]
MKKNTIKYYLQHPILLSAIIDQHFFHSMFSQRLWKTCQCSFCKKRFHHFMIHGYVSELVQKHNTTLGPRFSDCPYCYSVDKYRWLWHVLEHNTNLKQLKNGKILHFAPEKPILSKIKKFIGTGVEYITGDLAPGHAEHIVDMTDIQFANDQFDLIIACNVLEHIPDEQAAIRELKRVLKPNGVIVLMIPICFDMDTFEDPSINSDEKRLRYYRQEDHVRLYGNDYVKQFEKYGLNIKNIKPEKYFSSKEQKQYGLTKVSPILLCRK